MTTLAILALSALTAAAEPDKPARPDIIYADFEGTDYGDWKVTGTAFGKGPARGTLPNQMPVTGFKGKGLVNSYHGGDGSIGTLTSPEFTISRRYISFLIGGGHHPGKACIDLMVGGKVVRTATGPNKVPGGTERLDPASWDVSDLAGKKARIRIVDEATGGWGHINIDHIVFTDSKPDVLLIDAKREITAEKAYLLLPVKTGAAKRMMKLLVDGRTWRELEIELAESTPDFRAFVDLQSVRGKRVTVQLDRMLSSSSVLRAVEQSDKPTDPDKLYKEKHRPQFHFTARRGWLNDPNGLVYHKGEYHLFFQHNPYGWNWGNMHWGHAVSKDLIHWQDLPIAIYPRPGDWAFSGSGVVDKANTSGLKKGDEDTLIAAFTSTARGECIAYSNDLGRTWQEQAGNPVVKHAGRDPKVIWHAPTKRWVMAVYDEHAGKRWIAFHTSGDLKKWKFASRIEGFYECPDLFELPVNGKQTKAKWVLYAADGNYVLGSFDGKTFKTESGKHTLWHGNFYAAQTFSDAPDGRRIQIGWGSGIVFPGMPFNQQMTIPCDLSLRTTPDGVRMFAVPVKEIDSLHKKKHSWKDIPLDAKENPLAKVTGELFDIRASVSVGKAETIEFTLRGTQVVYDAKKQTLTCKGRSAPLKAVDGRVQLRMLVDRGSIEIFGNDGAVAMSIGVLLPDKERALAVAARGAGATASLEVTELRSSWTKR